MASLLRDKKVVSWTFYDWANSAFATTVMAGFFPIFFKKYLSSGMDVTESTLHLGVANSIASLTLAVLSPWLGSLADQGSHKKRFLIFFAYLGVLMTLALAWVGKGDWQLGALLYVFGTIGFAGGNIFYDSLLPSVAPREKRDFVSALGYGFGYLGGGLLLALNVVMVLKPELFGFADAGIATKASFISVAIWWGLFTIPLILWVPEPDGKKVQGIDLFKESWKQLRDTFKEIKKYRQVVIFLGAFFLYIDGVHTIIRMAVDYGLSLGFDQSSLITALLLVQFVGFPAAIAWGKVAEKIGPKTGVVICIFIYCGVTVWGYLMSKPIEFFAIAVLIGLGQGGVQALSRSIYSNLIPENQAAEFFGFYNIVGKFSSVIGPTMVGVIGAFFGNPRIGLFSLIILFIAGLLILRKVEPN